MVKLSLLPSWISRDGKVIILARGMRAFAHGTFSVLLAIYLTILGFNVVQIGLFITLGLAGAAFFAFLVGLFSNSLGRRHLLVAFSMMTATAGAVLVTTDKFVLLSVVAFLGSFSASGGAGGGGPLQPLEQASLSEASAPERRTDLFAIYGMVATGAASVGALAAGLPALYQDIFGISELGAFKVMFLGYSLFNVLGGLLYTLLSRSVEVDTTGSRWVNPMRLPSRRLIFTLSGLFSVDFFAGGLVIQTLVSYWFFTRFGVDLGSIAFIFFGSNALAAISLWVAAKLADRVGLINTMVFTHIPSSVALIAIPFVPVAWMAVGLWLARSALGSMDVPTRESYTMAVVRREERVAMASVNTVTRSIAVSASPSVATLLWNMASASVPFVTCGVMKIGYDLSLYFMFRNVKPPEEAR